jgi:hypothetical protein
LGFDITANGKVREQPPGSKLLSGEQEAKVIATRLRPPPTGFVSWIRRPLADQFVELEIVPSVSHETVRQTLKELELVGTYSLPRDHFRSPRLDLEVVLRAWARHTAVDATDARCTRLK